VSAPFLTSDAIDHINQLGVKHLLVDLPSIDKTDDGGVLGNHRSFFNKGDTISELLYIPNDLLDGFGFLQIQIPNWSLDSAPSRPIFFSV
jgi:kynurenine formamidase